MQRLHQSFAFTTVGLESVDNSLMSSVMKTFYLTFKEVLQTLFISTDSLSDNYKPIFADSVSNRRATKIREINYFF